MSTHSEELSAQQKQFVEHYVAADFNATQAAIKAGYSEKTAAQQASRLLSSVKVQDYLSVVLRRVNEDIQIDQQYVVSRLHQVTERCLQAEPVKVKGFGGRQMQLFDEEKRAVYQFDAGGATKALEILAKSLGMLTEKVEVTDKAAVAGLIMARRQKLREERAAGVAQEAEDGAAL